jgi:anti-sigma factor ChrR (cupin superfamily)
MSETQINGDLSRRVCVDTRALEWSPSPSRTVWRKRLHLVGPAEAGQVTSIVRYEPGAVFPSHDHPGGEEILVLAGTFSDEHGDWPAGTYLLNPEGFRHAPFSRSGCLLFVKLRQYPGRDRVHVSVDTSKLAWAATSESDVEAKILYSQHPYLDTVAIEHWSPHARLRERSYEHGAEYFVLEGSFADEMGVYHAGTWLRMPAASGHQPRTTEGCITYAKCSGLAYLRSSV